MMSAAHYSNLLPISIFFPLGAAVFLLIYRHPPKRFLQVLTFLGFAVPFLIALYIVFTFSPPNPAGFAYLFDFDTGLAPLGITLKLGLNGISLPLYFLAATVGLAAGLYALNSDPERMRLYYILLLVMHGGLMGVFASIDIFFFYFFHELALIPTFLMIGIWGGDGRRAAAMEMTIYLTLGALLSLLGLIAIYVKTGAVSFDLLTLRDLIHTADLTGKDYQVLFGLLLFGFGILFSLFPFHSWAPSGYTAAPTPTSMLHAGVLKKFGLYGLLQIAAPLLGPGAEFWTPAVGWLALGNILVIGLVTVAQRNLKRMVSYASVMHMGYAFLGIACLSVVGVGGTVLMMFAHGLSVSLLFLLTTCIHHRTQTFDLSEMGGLGPHAPTLGLLFIGGIFASIGLPGFANFWGEFAIFLALWHTNPYWVVFAALGVILSAIYGLRAVANIFFGEPTEAFASVQKNQPVSDLTWIERIPAFLLLGALLWVGIWPRTFSDNLNADLLAVYPDEYHSKHKFEFIADDSTPEASYRISYES